MEDTYKNKRVKRRRRKNQMLNKQENSVHTYLT